MEFDLACESVRNSVRSVLAKPNITVRRSRASTVPSRTGEEGRNPRNMYQKLLIRITLQLWILLQPLRPCLLHDSCARSGRSFIQRPDSVKVDVLVQRVLDGGGNVVAVVVASVAVAVVMSVVMAIVLIVAVMRHCERSVCIGDPVMELSCLVSSCQHGGGWVAGEATMAALRVSRARGCDNYKPPETRNG